MGKKISINALSKPFLVSQKYFWEKVYLSDICFWEKDAVFGKIFGEKRQEMARVLKKNFKGRCTKRVLKKCKDVVRTYNEIQTSYADVLEQNEEITEFQCNVILDGLDIGDYSTDFLCVKKDGDLMVRECVERRYLMKPMTVKLLDASREYWYSHGVTDWGLVIDEEK